MTESKLENNEITEKGKKERENSNPNITIDYEFLLKILARLKLLLDKESYYLENKNFTSASELIEKKMDIINFLGLHKDEILTIYDSDDEELIEKKEELKELAQKLLHKSKVNMENVMREQYINEKTVKIIQDLVKNEDLKYKNYHSTGSKKKGTKANEDHYVLINKNV